MAFKIKITDYMSIESITMEVKGFTAYTGKNNTGKSNIMKAVKGLLTNEWSPLDLRILAGEGDATKRARNSIIELHFDDGCWVRWKRGYGASKKKTPDFKQYTWFNGSEEKVIESPGSKCPDEVLDLVGMRGILIGQTKKAGNDPLWANISMEGDGKFLIDRPASFIAEAVSNQKNINVLSTAAKLEKSLEKGAKSTLKLREKDKVAQENELKVFDRLDEALDLGAIVEVLVRETETLKVRVSECTLMQQSLEASAFKRDSLAPVLSASPPDDSFVGHAQDSLQEVRSLNTLSGALGKSKASVDVLADVIHAKPPTDEVLRSSIADLKNASALGSLGESLVESRSMVQRLGSAKDCLLPSQEQLGLMGKILRFLQQNSLTEKDLESKKKALKGLQGISDEDAVLGQIAAKIEGSQTWLRSHLDLIATLKAKEAQIESHNLAAEDLKAKQMEAEKHFQEAESKRQEALKSLGYCPECKRPCDEHDQRQGVSKC